MKKIYLKLSIMALLLLGVIQVNAQIATTISGGSSAAGSYTSFVAAVNALNLSTITGAVTVDLTAGQSENLTGKILITATGTISNPITIQKSGVGVNPVLIAYNGIVATPSSIADGMVALIGSDYITIDGLDLQENVLNTTTTTVMEYGYALLKASPTDGCQYNSIKNCTITLNRVQTTGWTAPGHQGSTGIVILNALHTATGNVAVTAPSGSNSYNTIYSNTIQNCNAGITLNGRMAAAMAAPYKFDLGGFGDTGNDIGGNSSATGNTIINFGGQAASTNPATGIWGGEQWDLNISYNTINNNNGSGFNHPSTVRGILLGNPITPASPASNVTCNYNTITIKGGGTTSQITGIESTLGANVATYTNTLNFNFNTVTTEYPTATSGVSYGIYHLSSAPNHINMNNNSVTMSSAATSGTVTAIWNSGAVPGSINQNDNTINAFNFTAATTSLALRGVYNTGGVVASTILNQNNNTISALNFTGLHTGLFNFIAQTAAVSSETLTGNVLTNLTFPTSGGVQLLNVSNSSTGVNIHNNSITGINNNNVTAGTTGFQLIYNFGSPSSGTLNVYSNTFNNITCNRSATGIGSSAGAMGIHWATLAGPTQNIYSNTITNFTNTGAGLLTGIFLGYGTNNNVYSNIITNYTSAGAVAGLVIGNSSTVNANTYNNTIMALTSSTSAAYGIVSGITATSGPTGIMNTYANKICNISSTAATGTSNGIYHFRGNTTNYYNNVIGDIFAPNSTSGTAVTGINIAATAADIVRVYFNTVHLPGTSSASGFGSSSLMTTSGTTTATPPLVDIRNNIFNNITTPTGTGLAVGNRRLGTVLTAFNTASDNNVWYSGTPSVANLIYYDGVNSDITIEDYKLRVTPREIASLSFDVTPNLASLTCTDPNYLHINPSIATQLESGGQPISTPAITTDVDGDTRSATPDIGADEFIGTTPAPAIVFGSMVPGITPNCAATDRLITVDVTTVVGSVSTVYLNYNYNGVAQTPVLMTNTVGDTYEGIIPAAIPSGATVTWTVVATNSILLTSTYNGSAYTYSDDVLSTLLVTATASTNPLCDGTSAVLTASVAYPTAKILGAGATTSATYSNPFYSAWSNTHNQHLILASELTALGMVAGNISALGMNITVAGTLPMLDFSMKIGSTNATNLSSFSGSPLTTVYTSASWLPTVGINTMPFSTPFYWDGISNVLIEICHGNPASTITMTRTCQTDNTSFISCIHTHKTVGTGGTSQCTDNVTNLTTYSVRPRFYFTAEIGTSNFVWNDGSSNIGTTQSITVNPGTNTTYSVSMDALGCNTSASITVNVTPVPSAPTAINSTQCGGGIPTASVSSNAGGLGTGGFYWYDAPIGGNLVQGPPLGNTLVTYYNNDFSTSTLGNASLAGNASIGSGILTLTPILINQAGAITVNEAGTYSPTMLEVNFTATSALLTGVDIADGFSYSFGDDVSATATTPTTAEYGTGTKLKIGFDSYGAAAGAAGIYIIYGTSIQNPGQTIGTNGVLAYSNNISWVNSTNVPMQVTVDATGLCTVSVNGTPVLSGVQLPAAYVNANKANWKHVIKARSGGIAGGFSIDDLDIKTNTLAAGTTTWLNSISATQNWYVAELALNGCNTYRTPVTATVTTPPTLTVTSSRTICNDYVQTLEVTSTVSDYTNYIWSPNTNLFEDLACTIPYTGTSLSTVYFKSSTPSSTTFTLNSNETVNNCSNSTTVTINVLPAAITVSSTPASLCLSGNLVLSFTPISNLYTSTLQWSESPTGSGYIDIPTATGLTHSVTALSTTTYYQMSITDGNGTVCLQDDQQVLVDNPQIVSTTPATRCGIGTVNLVATPSSTETIRWFANATGGSPLASGSTFTTPTISATTTYYASAASGLNSYSAGRLTNPTAGGALAASPRGVIFSTTGAVTLNELGFLCTGAATNLTVRLYDAAGTTQIGTDNIVSIPANAGTASVPVLVTQPVGISVPAAGTYRIFVTGFTVTTPSPLFYEFSGVTGYPYTQAGGALSINGSVTSLTGTQSLTTYYYFYKIGWTEACETPRQAVVATVTAPPTLTTSIATKTICNDGIQQIDVTSNIPDFDTYIWSPSTNLYTDASATTPYDGISSSTTIYFKSSTPGSHTITVIGSNAAGCVNSASSNIRVLPASITVSSAPTSLCVSGSATLSFTPTTNLFDATYQWASSPTGSSYTDIFAANANAYSTVGLTASGFYQVTIKDNDNNVCLVDDYELVVNNPVLVSTTPGTRCGTGTVNLSATPATTETINWYANATGGTPLGTGNAFATPVISATTTFYASAVAGISNYSAGRLTTQTAGSALAGVPRGVIFSTISAVTLNELGFLCTGTATNLTVRLYDAAGTTQIGTDNIVSIPANAGTASVPVLVTQPVSILVPAAGTYRIFVTGFTVTTPSPLYYEFSGVTGYPYTQAGGALSIDGSATSLTGVLSTTTYYYFYKIGWIEGCETARQPVVATVTSAPAITVSNTAICDGQTATLDVTSSNPDYTYTWTPGNLVGATQSVNPTASTTYTVNALDNTAGAFAGCALIATQTVTVNPLPTISSSTATPSSVNPGCGTSVTLSATTSAPTTAVLGNPASTTTSATSGLIPYNSNWEGSRVQYLILASEMNALGFQAGSISSLGFDVTALGGGAFAQSGFTVKFGHTSTSAFAGAYITPTSAFTTVYGPVTQGLPTLGINTMPFSTPFIWDGVSNIVLDICHDNDINNTCASCWSSSSTTRYTATTFNSVYGKYGDNVQACGVNSTSTTTTFVNRPNMYLNGISGQVTNRVWEPGTLANPATVTPTATTTYTVTATNPITGCSITASTTVTVNPNATISGLAASYNVTDAAVTMTGTPSGGVFSGPGVTGSSFDPATAGIGTHTISYLPTGYCVPATATVTVVASIATLNLTCFLQGFYAGGGTMNSTLANQGLPNPLTDCDDVIVDLHDAVTPPYATVYSYSGVLQTNGTIACTFPSAAVGNSYYIGVRHRNSIETWSAAPVAITSTTSYNFSTAATQAFGGNQFEVETGVWGFYTGDINQDYAVDGLDFILLDPDLILGSSGYLATDLNGDGTVDALDYVVFDPNLISGITIVTP